MPKLSLGVKAKLYDELKRFLMIFAYLWLVFLVFLVHEVGSCSPTTTSASDSSRPRWINALVLSKIMLIAEERDLPKVRRQAAGPTDRLQIRAVLGTACCRLYPRGNHPRMVPREERGQ